jgi:hypothetical protein
MKIKNQSSLFHSAKYFILFAFLFFSKFSLSQTPGCSIQSLFYFPGYDDLGSIKHMHNVIPGIRGEINFFPKGFHGIGIDYFFPMSDSSMITVSDGFGGTKGVVGVKKRSTLDIMARFGYKIPQSFNDFLTLHIGFGSGFTEVFEQTVYPTSGVVGFPETKAPGFSLELLGGGIYELKYFFVFAQFSYIYTISELSHQNRRDGFVFGIYLPFKRNAD